MSAVCSGVKGGGLAVGGGGGRDTRPCQACVTVSDSTDTCALCTFNCELDLTSSPSTPLLVITQARCLF